MDEIAKAWEYYNKKSKEIKERWPAKIKEMQNAALADALLKQEEAKQKALEEYQKKIAEAEKYSHHPEAAKIMLESAKRRFDSDIKFAENPVRF